jgi:type III pantothenate kinase
MDIDVLVISVGNTRTALAAFRAGEFISSQRVPTTDEPALRSAISELWKLLAATEDAGVAAASVNPPANALIERLVRELCDEPVAWVGGEGEHAIDLPIDVLTDAPKSTGVDRVLNVAAAYEQLGKACVVVDAGTAVTIDMCNNEGDFLGGAIAPGVRAQLAALGRSAAQLRTSGILPSDTAASPITAPAMTAPKDHIGTSTDEAIRSGIFFGLRGLTKELLEAFATQQGTWPELIATGGDAELLFKGWELTHAISPDLTLYGIALAYTNHHIEHGT